MLSWNLFCLIGQLFCFFFFSILLNEHFKYFPNFYHCFLKLFSQRLPQNKENRISSTSWHHLTYISMIIPISILPITPQNSNFNLCQSYYWKIKWFLCLFKNQWVRICFYMVTDICISDLDYFRNGMLLLLLLSRFSRVRLYATPQTAAHQAPPSLGFSRQEHWSGLPFPSPMHESEKWKWSCSVVSDS